MTLLEYIVISVFVVFVSICSLGILMFPAISSCYYYYYKRFKDKQYVQFRILITGIKKNYKQTIPLGLVQLLILYIGYINHKNFGLFSSDSQILYYGIIGASLLLFLHNFYTLQLVTFFDVSLVKAINLSSYFLLAYIFSTLTIILLFVALVFSIFLQPVLITIVLGFFIHLSSRILMAIFIKHSPKEDNDD